MSNLLTEIKEINIGLKEVYEEPVVQNLYNVYLPKLVDSDGGEFDFIREVEGIKKRVGCLGGSTHVHGNVSKNNSHLQHI